MKLIACAGCGAPMEPVLGVCAACRRPNDEGEIERGLAAERESKIAVRWPPMRVAKYAGAVAFVVFGYMMREIPKQIFDGWQQQFSEDMEKAAGSGKALKGLPDPAPAAPEAPVPMYPAAPAPPKPPKQTVSLPPPPPPGPPPVGVHEFRLTGRVMNLKTLKPVTGVRILFISPESGANFYSDVDSKGAYQMVLSKEVSDGYTVRIESDAYVPWMLCERDIPYLKLSAADRDQLISVANDGDSPPSRLSPPSEGPRLTADLFAAPVSAPPPAQ